MEHRFIAMLALEQPAAVTAEQIVAEIHQRHPDFKPHIQHVPGKTSAPGSALLLSVGNSMLSVMLVDQALPPGTLDRAIEADRIWPEAKQQLARHRAHIIVGAVSAFTQFPDALEQARAVTMIAAAISTLAPAIAIYWAAGDTVSEAGRFRTSTEELLNGRPPLEAWVQLWWLDGPLTERGERTLAVITTGMGPFIGRELEFEPAPLPPLTIAERLLGTMQYLLMKGPVLNDNDTLGISEQERIRVRHRPRGQRSDVPVLSLGVEQINVNELGE